MPRPVPFVVLAAALTLAGCGFRVAPADGGADGTAAGGDIGVREGGRPGSGLVGTWVGTPDVVEADGVRLTPEMQAQVRAHTPPMEFTFADTGAVTMTVAGRATTFSRAGEIVIGGDPLNGVVSNYEVKSIRASAARIDLDLWNRSGASSADHRDPVLRDDTNLSTWTFVLSGDRVEMRCVGRTKSNTTGRQSAAVLTATLTRGAAAGGATPGAW